MRWRAPDWDQVAKGAKVGLRRLAPLFAAVAAITLVAVGGWRGWVWLKHSPRFAVHQVVVTGNARVTPAQIAALASAAGARPGVNLFSVSIGKVARAVEQDPWISDARVSRQLPDALRVEIDERQPAGLLVVDDGTYLVEADGRPFKRATLEGGEAEGLVVVTGMSRATWTRDADGSAAAVREALLAARRWHENAERPAVGEVHLERAGVTLYTLEGAIAVRLGRARGADQVARLRRFDAIWAALSDEERGACKTIYLDSATRADRVTVQLADAR
jgi:cell division protein FtsQ